MPRIIALEPFLAETLIRLGAGNSLVGVSHDAELAEGLVAQKVTVPKGGSTAGLSKILCTHEVDLKIISELSPDIIVTRLADETARARIELELRRVIGRDVRLGHYGPTSFETVLAFFSALARDTGLGDKGLELSNKIKAQVMVWGDNFYDRMKNKKVTFLSSVSPLVLGGLWIPDMIHLASAESQSPRDGKPGSKIEFKDITSFRPDVIVVAIAGAELKESMATFRVLEKLEGWEQIPAVKRGEVIFAEGKHLFSKPTPALLDAMGVLVSAIAGFESGYITPRDSFQRLRWMELHRDKY